MPCKPGRLRWHATWMRWTPKFARNSPNTPKSPTLNRLAFSTYVWAVSANGTAGHRADLSAAQLSDMIRTLRADLDPTGPSRAAAPLSAPANSRRGPSFDGATAYQLYQQPSLPRSEALRRAMLGVMQDGSDPTLAHPSAWAPFVVVGEGGALSQ
ncbi:MAG: hypothetical protein ACI8R4_003875 [Paracoccaceae bacterium]|jgi:hypothetical protein